MIAEMQAAGAQAPSAPSAPSAREQMIAEMQAAGYKPQPIESSAMKAADLLNTVGGTSRAGWQDMIEPALGMDPSPATPVDPQTRLDLALKGKYPSTREIYQLDKRLPGFTTSEFIGGNSAKTGAPPTPGDTYNPLAAAAGAAGDIATDATGAVLGVAAKPLGMIGEYLAPMLRKAAALSPEESFAFNTATKSGFKDKARAAANTIADLIDQNPDQSTVTGPISTGARKVGKAVYASGLAPMDEAAAKAGGAAAPKPSDIFWDNNTFVRGNTAAEKTRNYIDNALNENFETFGKAQYRTENTLGKLADALQETEANAAGKPVGPPKVGPLTSDQALLKDLLARKQAELLAQPDEVTQYLRQRLNKIGASPEGASARNFGEQRVAEENLWGPQDVETTVDEAKRLRQGAKPAYGQPQAPEVTKMKQDLVRGRNDALSRILENIPDAGEDVKNAVRIRNRNAGSMINAEDAAEGMGGKSAVTPADVAQVAAMFGIAGKPAAMIYLGAKKGGQALLSPGGRSAVGLLLKAASAGGDAPLVQSYVHSQSPWSLLPPENR